MNTSHQTVQAVSLPKTTETLAIKIATDFSRYPGARYRKDGRYSGEEFRDTLLKPRFAKALEQGRKLHVNLDGAEGYATSFLEEAFGGLAREYGAEKVLNNIEFHSLDEPLLTYEIQTYIRETDRR